MKICEYPERITFRMCEELKEEIKEYAEDHELTMNETVRTLVKKGLKEE